MKKTLPVVVSSLAMAAAMAPAPAFAGPEEYLGQVQMVGFDFCPRWTMSAEGQILPISGNEALFSLYGTNFGGNGTSTFALPDLRGRIPIGLMNGNPEPGAMGGAETVGLTLNNLPPHNHDPRMAVAAVPADNPNPINNSLAEAAYNGYAAQAPGMDRMHQGTIVSQTVGQGIPFSNMQPFLAVRFCVTTAGVFPSRN
ncbi:phage tail protein [Alteriqipengyuania lutimaris]|nr:tail fiber protein [Alteriqipengyuania lutimaris]MBB3035233.1 microcystin-dependent protein [Alteriqipengyuania lutimaris]